MYVLGLALLSYPWLCKLGRWLCRIVKRGISWRTSKQTPLQIVIIWWVKACRVVFKNTHQLYLMSGRRDCERARLPPQTKASHHSLWLETCTYQEICYSSCFYSFYVSIQQSILVDDNGKAMITEFEFARRLSNVEQSYFVQMEMDGNVDYCRWWSPERIQNQLWNDRIDVWSWAMTILTIVTGSK